MLPELMALLALDRIENGNQRVQHKTYTGNPKANNCVFVGGLELTIAFLSFLHFHGCGKKHRLSLRKEETAVPPVLRKQHIIFRGRHRRNTFIPYAHIAGQIIPASIEAGGIFRKSFSLLFIERALRYAFAMLWAMLLAEKVAIYAGPFHLLFSANVTPKPTLTAL